MSTVSVKSDGETEVTHLVFRLLEGVLHQEDVVWFDVAMQVALSLHPSEERQHHSKKVLELGWLEVRLFALSLPNGLGKVGIAELHDQPQLIFAGALVFTGVVIRDLSLKGGTLAMCSSSMERLVSISLKA